MSILNREAGFGAFITQVQTIGGGFNRFIRTEDIGKEAAGFLHLSFIGRIQITDEIPASRAVTVDELKAHAVDHQTEAAPSLIKPFVKHHCGSLAVAAVFNGCLRGNRLDFQILGDLLRVSFLLLTGGLGIKFGINAKRKALEHFCFHRRVRRTRLPDAALIVAAGHDFNHRTVRDIDIGRIVVVALQANAVLILLTRGVCKVNNLADRAANNVLRKLGAVLRPFRFHIARLRILLANDETDGRPEVLHDRPEFFRRRVDAQPAILTVLHYLSRHRQRHNSARCSRRILT